MASLSFEVANDLKESAVSEGTSSVCRCTGTELSDEIPSLLYRVILLRR